MKHFYVFLLIMLGGLISSCEDDKVVAPAKTYSLAGTLSDIDNETIEAAILEVKSGNKIIATDTTDEDGNFNVSFETAAPATIDIVIRHDDFQSFSSTLESLLESNSNLENMPLQLQYNENCTSTFLVTVKNEEGNPIAGAEVKLRLGDKAKKKGETDDNGTVLFSNICPGTYNIRIAAESYQVKEADGIEFEEDSHKETIYTITQAAEEECCNNILIVYPKDKNSGEIIESAKVKLWKEGTIIEMAEIKNGKAIIDGICKGQYGVSIHADNYQTQDFSVEFDCEQTKEISKFLEAIDKDSCCEGRIKIIAKDKATGDNISQGTVKLWKDGKLLASKALNESGYAVFEGLCEGKYGVDILSELYENIEFSIELGCNENKVLEKSLVPNEENPCCEGRIKIIAKDKATGDNISQGTVKLWKDGKLLASKALNESGYAVFEGLCEGKYGVDILSELYENIEFSIELGCNENKVLEKSLVPNEENPCCEGKIKIIAKDKATGENISQGTVKLWKDGKLLDSKALNESGYAVFEGLCEGKYGVDILSELYENIEFSIELGCNENKVLEKSLVPNEENPCCEGRIKIIAKDKATGENISKGTVKLWKDGKLLASKALNESGYAVFEGLCEGKYGVDILSELYENIEFSIELGCNENKVLEKSLVPNEENPCCEGRIKIIAKDKATGENISQGTVKLWKDGKLLASKALNESGYAVFERLCEGKYGVDILSELYENIEFSIELGCNENKVLEKSLVPNEENPCCEGVVWVFPKDAVSGDKIVGAKVKLWQNGKVIAVKEVNGDGFAKFEGICEGNYAISILKETYQTKEFTFEIGCNKEREFVKELEKE